MKITKQKREEDKTPSHLCFVSPFVPFKFLLVWFGFVLFYLVFLDNFFGWEKKKKTNGRKKKVTKSLKWNQNQKTKKNMKQSRSAVCATSAIKNKKKKRMKNKWYRCVAAQCIKYWKYFFYFFFSGFYLLLVFGCLLFSISLYFLLHSVNAVVIAIIAKAAPILLRCSLLLKREKK